MLCPETSHNNNTVFVYVLTRRRVEEEVGNKGSGISVKVQQGGVGGVAPCRQTKCGLRFMQDGVIVV